MVLLMVPTCLSWCAVYFGRGFYVCNKPMADQLISVKHANLLWDENKHGLISTIFSNPEVFLRRLVRAQMK